MKIFGSIDISLNQAIELGLERLPDFPPVDDAKLGRVFFHLGNSTAYLCILEYDPLNPTTTPIWKNIGGGAEISDTEVTLFKTWSSQKIRDEIDLAKLNRQTVYDIAGSIHGVVPAGEVAVMRFVAVTPFYFENNFPNSQGRCENVDHMGIDLGIVISFTMCKNGVPFGQMTFTSEYAVFTGPRTDFEIRDVLTVLSPAVVPTVEFAGNPYTPSNAEWTLVATLR